MEKVKSEIEDVSDAMDTMDDFLHLDNVKRDLILKDVVQVLSNSFEKISEIEGEMEPLSIERSFDFEEAREKLHFYDAVHFSSIGVEYIVYLTNLEGEITERLERQRVEDEKIEGWIPQDFLLIIDEGQSDQDLVSDILADLSLLYRIKEGGSGINFEFTRTGQLKSFESV